MLTKTRQVLGGFYVSSAVSSRQATCVRGDFWWWNNHPCHYCSEENDSFDEGGGRQSFSVIRVRNGIKGYMPHVMGLF
jgi:hypothetical protein